MTGFGRTHRTRQTIIAASVACPIDAVEPRSSDIRAAGIRQVLRDAPRRRLQVHSRRRTSHRRTCPAWPRIETRGWAGLFIVGHPRARGKREHVRKLIRLFGGSSPRTGNASARKTHCTATTVHPRVRGNIPILNTDPVRLIGSSPGTGLGTKQGVEWVSVHPRGRGSCAVETFLHARPSVVHAAQLALHVEEGPADEIEGVPAVRRLRHRKAPRLVAWCHPITRPVMRSAASRRERPPPLPRLPLAHWIDGYQGSSTPLGHWGRGLLERMFAGGRLGLGDLVDAFVAADDRPPAPLRRGQSRVSAWEARQRSAALMVARGLEDGILVEVSGPRGGRGWMLASQLGFGGKNDPT